MFSLTDKRDIMGKYSPDEMNVIGAIFHRSGTKDLLGSIKSAKRAKTDIIPVAITKNDPKKHGDMMDNLIKRCVNGDDELVETVAEKINSEVKLDGKYAKIKKYVDREINQIYPQKIESEHPCFLFLPIETHFFMNIYGQSGSGKSYIASCCANMYKKLNPDNDIYLISSNTAEDNVYKGLNIKILDTDSLDEMMEHQIDETAFPDSLVIFDDIENSNKDIYNFIAGIRDTLLQRGRKHGTSIINIIHKALDNHKTKISNNESNYCCVFPQLGWSNAKKLLSSYYELSDKQLLKVHGIRKYSRWVIVKKEYPKYMVWEHGFEMLE